MHLMQVVSPMSLRSVRDLLALSASRTELKRTHILLEHSIAFSYGTENSSYGCRTLFGFSASAFASSPGAEPQNMILALLKGRERRLICFEHSVG
jgi:hypothetical protein